MDAEILIFAFTFLIAACVIVPLSKLAGLGPIIGYIGTGILIGPTGLKLIAEPNVILQFSEFGVVMMLFLIGLELHPSELWRMRTKLLGLGGLQVSITLAAIAGALIAIGLQLSVALSIAMALSLSSTAVALQIMQEKNLLQTRAGQAGFSILLFQDVSVIAMVAMLPLIATFAGVEQQHLPDLHNQSELALRSPSGIWYSAAVIAVFVGMVIGGRLLLKPIFRLIARAGVREIFTAIALALIIGASLIMDWLGLSAALGAFTGGVMLAESEYRHQLERDIEPFKALLLGLFFASVGMSLDFAVMAANPALILFGVVALMTIKFVIVFGVARIFGASNSSALVTGILVCQAGEFGFVLFQFARVQGLMSAEFITQASAIIVLSMALTPLLFVLFSRLIASRISSSRTVGKPPINEREKVLILGFGRMGQIAHRLLHTQDIRATLIDHDGDHIEFIRQFGNRVYYGDATDLDLLRLAGANQAKVIIISIDDPDQVLRVVKICKKHFPDAKLVARAKNRNHMFELMALGVDFVERETVRAALAMGRETLRYLGVEKEYADQLMDAFLRYDFKMIEKTWRHRDDIDELIAHAADTREYLRDTLGDADAGEQVDDVLKDRTTR